MTMGGVRLAQGWKPRKQSRPRAHVGYSVICGVPLARVRAFKEDICTDTWFQLQPRRGDAAVLRLHREASEGTKEAWVQAAVRGAATSLHIFRRQAFDCSWHQRVWGVGQGKHWCKVCAEQNYIYSIETKTHLCFVTVLLHTLGLNDQGFQHEQRQVTAT